MLAVTTGTVLLSAFVMTKRMTPVYIASADLKIQRASSTKGFLSDYIIWGNVDFVGTESLVIRSWPVMVETCQRMGWLAAGGKETETLAKVRGLTRAIEIEKTGYTNILRISYSGPEPQECARVVNVVAEVYRERALSERNAELERLRAYYQKEMERTEKGLVEAERAYQAFQERVQMTGVREPLVVRLSELRVTRQQLLKQYQPQHPKVVKIESEIAALEQEISALPRHDLEEARHKREMSAAQARANQASAKYYESLGTEGTMVGTTEIVSPAQPPREPVRPIMALNLLIGGAAGLFLGFLGALMLEQIDTSISDIEEVESFMKRPVLGLVPRIAAHVLVVARDPKSSGAEAFRSLLINLRFIVTREQPMRLLITSAGVDEGKTVTAANIALVMAEGGRRTVLVEGDLRRPTLSRVMEIRRGPGLSEALLGDERIEDVLQAGPLPSLSVISSGRVPPNPMDLLSRPGLDRLIQSLSERFDIVIIDSPPVLPVADALVMASLVDGVVLVYKVGATSRGALKRSMSLLDQARANVLGIVLNDVRTQLTADYDYAKYYRYYGRPASPAGVVERGRGVLRRWQR